MPEQPRKLYRGELEVLREGRQRLGNGVWLLLLLRAWGVGPDNRVRSGTSIRASDAAAALGIRERQIRRELQRLRRAGYVELHNTGRGFEIRLVDVPGVLGGEHRAAEPRRESASIEASR